MDSKQNKKRPLTDSPRYNAFTRARDLALEKIHNNARANITNHLQSAFREALETVSLNFSKIPNEDAFTPRRRNVLRLINGTIEAIFDISSVAVWEEVKAMRRSVYILARASEAEAIGRALARPTMGHIDRHSVNSREDGPSPAGGPFLGRIQLYFARVRRDMMSALEQSLLMGEDHQLMLERVYRALPKRKFMKRVPRILKDPKTHMTEANIFLAPFAAVGRAAQGGGDDGGQKPPERVSFGFGMVDEKDWEKVVDAYKTEFIATDRGPEAVVGRIIPEKRGQDEQLLYEWELERDVTQAFVEDVRSGQIDAAATAGIIDFVWIAVVDDKTDECCVWRDGLTTTEIEQELGGSHKDDECRATTPPAHFNCRCTLAPITSDLPEAPSSNEGDFDSWLNS